jgi:Undecaprenyl-phosphate galactose phosphotransferase WbaP
MVAENAVEPTSAPLGVTRAPDSAAAAQAGATGTRLPPFPRRAFTVAALVVSDLVSLMVAGVAAGLVASTGLIASGWAPLERFGYLALLVPVAYGFAGLYPGVGVSPVDELRRLTVATSAVAVASIASIALVGNTMPSWVLVLAGLFALVTVPLARAAARAAFARRSWWGVPVVLLGAGRTADLIIERLRHLPRVGMKPVACLDDDPDKIGAYVRGVPVTGPLFDVSHYQRRGVRHALLAMPGLEPRELLPLLRHHGRGFPVLIIVPNLFGIATIGVATRDLGGVLGLHVKHNLLSRFNRIAKALLDIVLLVPALVVGLPVIALAAVAVALASPGNPFYAQERQGRNGRTIRVWKLRTMHPDADRVLERYLDTYPEARAEWERHYKLRHDPRVIPGVGHFLRRTSLDELPQLLNVLRGEMSFVGPRPFPDYHMAAFDEGFRELRSMVRPGITGLWQVVARSDGDLRVQEEADTFYIHNWCIWLDLYVLARTPLAVLSANGAR